MPSDNETDLALLEQLREGRDSAMNELMARWQRPLLSFAYRYVQSEEDARDLVEELFVRVYKNRERFQAGTKFSAWAFTSLSNLCKNLERWKRRHPAFYHDSLTDDWSTREADIHPLAQAGDIDPPDLHVLNQERIEIVKEAIEKLPHDLKVTLLLYQYESLSYKEIGEIVGCSIKGVETRLYRARKSLKTILCSKIGRSGDIWGHEESVV